MCAASSFICKTSLSVNRFQNRFVPATVSLALHSAGCAIAFISIIVLAVSVPCAAQGTTNQYLRLTPYPTGGTPTRITTADFNRDGKADLVALNSNGVVSVLLGTGTGAFAASKSVAALGSAAASARLAAADFNGDGNPDILLLGPPGNAVKVYGGHGDGTFSSPVSIADGLPAAAALAMGDFNNDGRQDIAVAGTLAVSILQGIGSGYFAKPQVTATSLTAAGPALIMAVGDLNRDSHLDIVATDGNGNLQILLGSATGALHSQAVLPIYDYLPGSPNVLAIADFNGDGKPDIAAGSGVQNPQYTYPRVCFFNGNGDGTIVANSPPCMDIVLDSFSEMLVTNVNGKPGFTFTSDPLMLFNNDGTGVFSATTYSVGGPLALADFNGDGRQDIASGSSGGVQVVLNAGGGMVRAPLALVQSTGPFTYTVSMSTADVNSDGHSDLVLGSAWNEHGYLFSSVQMLLGGRRNTFTHSSGAGVNFFTGNAAVSPPAIGDFNHDGLLDVAYSASFFSATDQIDTWYEQVIFGDGKGNFVSSGPELSFPNNFLIAGYFNAGGVEDLASLNNSNVEIRVGNGNGTFSGPKAYAAGANPVFTLQRDLNNDGKRDLVVANHDSDTISILLGNGDGTFKTQKTYAAGTLPTVAVTGDFNRDGKVDIAVGSNTGISVLLGNGDGTFQSQKLYPGAGPVTGIAQASVRQDGIECLLAIDSASARFVLLPGHGDGSFGSPVFYPVDQVPVLIQAADFDGDGATDVALATALRGIDTFTGQPIGGNLAIYYNQGGDHVSLTSSSLTPKPGQSVTLTAQVTVSPTEPGTPSGKITFKDGTRFLGTVSMAAGSASITTTFAAGSHSILAQYSGDANFNPNHSATVNVSVAP